MGVLTCIQTFGCTLNISYGTECECVHFREEVGWFPPCCESDGPMSHHRLSCSYAFLIRQQGHLSDSEDINRLCTVIVYIQQEPTPTSVFNLYRKQIVTVLMKTKQKTPKKLRQIYDTSRRICRPSLQCFTEHWANYKLSRMISEPVNQCWEALSRCLVIWGPFSSRSLWNQ